MSVSRDGSSSCGAAGATVGAGIARGAGVACGASPGVAFRRDAHVGDDGAPEYVESRSSCIVTSVVHSLVRDYQVWGSEIIYIYPLRVLNEFGVIANVCPLEAGSFPKSLRS